MNVSAWIKDFGWPRLIIAGFLFFLFALSPFIGIDLPLSLSDTMVRFGMNGILVLAMLPMIQSGCGLNFGLPLGIISGLLGSVLSIEMQLHGFLGFLMAIFLGSIFAVVAGYGYGKLLNRVKGSEMLIATYVGFSAVSFMCLMWIALPLKSPSMVWGFGGTGLRATISTEGYYFHILDEFLPIQIGSFHFPTGMFLFFALFCFVIWLFFRTKKGMALTATGSNSLFAYSCGIDTDKMRTLSVILSTVLGAIGIVVYQQSFGFIQLYMGPFYMAFPAIAAILIGGASINKASITNVLLGTFLFQGILTMTPTVMSHLIQANISEIIRIIISNGMILYALTRGRSKS